MVKQQTNCLLSLMQTPALQPFHFQMANGQFVSMTKLLAQMPSRKLKMEKQL